MEAGKKVNDTRLRGYAAFDAKVNTVSGGKDVANFTFAVPTGWKDEDPDMWYDFAVWFNDTPRDRFKFDLAKDIKKGDLIEVKGHLRKQAIVDDRDGNPRVYNKFHTESITVWKAADRPASTGGGGGSSRSGGRRQGEPLGAPPKVGEDDIPF